jgi:hypothetical protein
MRRGRPSWHERPEQVGFVPTVPVALRLDADAEPRAWVGSSWRRKVDVPACRLVWVGDVISSPGPWPGWQVEILVAPLTGSPSMLELQALTVPISVVGLLFVGRVLREPEYRAPPSGFGGPGPGQHCLGSEWIVELSFGTPQTAIVSAAELGLALAPLPAHVADWPACVTSDPHSGRLVIIPCWEIFRYYYAQSPVVARQVLEFPRWRAGMFERLLSYFDGHRFREVVRANVPSPMAAEQLRSIGRDAVVAYARRGRIQLRIMPPLVSPTTLQVVGLPAVLAGREVLVVQQILDSRALGDGAGIRWWSLPVLPRFESRVEYVAWWVMYYAGDLRTAIVPPLASWEAFVETVEQAPHTLALCEDPWALRTALLQTLARKRAFVSVADRYA